jgi:hypothetical protein
LPDGLFSDQKLQFGYILEGLAMKDVGVFDGHLVYVFYGHYIYFMNIWNILWLFGIFVPILVYFPQFWYIFPNFGILYQEKSGNPVPRQPLHR